MTHDEGGQVGMRRAPQQPRGQQRVAAILGAAEAIFSEVGYEAATTNAIATRAGVPIGSLYQFFPHKGAILHAVALRYIGEMRALHGTALSPEAAAQPIEVTVGGFIDAFVAFQQDHAGFGAVLSATAHDPGVAAATEELHGELVARVEGLMRLYMPDLDPALLQDSALVSVYLVKGVMPLIEGGGAELRGRVVRELKAALLAYIASLQRRSA